jgi:hypothetical protein
VVDDDAGVGEAGASVVVADADVREVVNADWICIPSVVEATKSLEPVVHVI